MRKSQHYHIKYEGETTEHVNIDAILAVAAVHKYIIVKQAWVVVHDDRIDEKWIEAFIEFDIRKNVTKKMNRFFEHLGTNINAKLITYDTVPDVYDKLDKMTLICEKDTLKQDNIDIYSYVNERNTKKRKRDSQQERIIELAKKDKKFRKLENLEPEIGSLVYFGKKQISTAISILNDLEDKREKRDFKWEAPEPTLAYGDQWYKVMKWMQKCIRTDLICRRKHLFLYGETATGKSTRFLNILRERLYCWEISKDEIQNNNYLGDYDLIFCDEYNKPYKPVPFLNDITTYTNGKSVGIRVPGGYFDPKCDFPPVLIISNHSLDELYCEYAKTNPESFEALKARFYEIQLDQQGNPFGISNVDSEQQTDLDDFILN